MAIKPLQPYLRVTLIVTVSLNLLVSSAGVCVPQATAVPGWSQDLQLGSFSLSPQELKQGVAESITKVDEFRFIRKAAQELGVKAYLFGGTASAFAHYVKWDLMRKKGDPRFYPNRFDFRYINIYRSNQDLDIVVDGPSSAIRRLQSLLSEHFPYLQGTKGAKNAWEVRSLRQTEGDKIALIDNPDFLNQHTDSHSVGLIEITEGETTESIIRDLKDWDNLNNNFLMDVLEGKIHFYFSPKHSSTKYFKEGRNPPIVAVIRYLIKAFQFELHLHEEDLAKIYGITREFNPNSMKGNTYLERWFANNVPKLIQNSMDVEYSMVTLEQLELKEKLSEIGSRSSEGSIAWWMNKEPLPSWPIGTSGATAKSLGIDIVSHETTSFFVYESITRSHKGVPNVLMSRRGVVGERAIFGDGLYTIKGMHSGFIGSGFNIRFKVHPQAREGKDFTIVDNGAYIVFHNRRVLQILPDSLNLDLPGYFSLLVSTKDLTSDDLGVLHRLKLALRSQMVEPTGGAIAYLESAPIETLLLILERDKSPEVFQMVTHILSQKQINKEAFWKIVDAGVSLFMSESSDQPETKTQRERYERWLAKKIPSLVMGLDLDVQDFERMSKMQLFSSPEIQITLLEKKRLFLRSLPQKLDFNSFIETFRNGLFKGLTVEFWTEVLNLQPTIEQLLSAYRIWESYNRSEKLTLAERKILYKVWSRFYELKPNEQHVKDFDRDVRNPNVIIAMAALNFGEPISFAMSVGRSIERDRTKIDAYRRVWRHKAEQFFAMNPSAGELVEIAGLISDPVIDLDLLKYANSKNIFRRRLQMFEFLKKIDFPKQEADAVVQGFNEALKVFVQKYIAMEPSELEIRDFLTHISVTGEVMELFLAAKNFRIQNSIQLSTFLRSFPKPESIGNFMRENPSFLQRIPLSDENLELLLKSLKDTTQIEEMIRRYVIENEQRQDKVLSILLKYQEKLRPVLADEYWSTFGAAFESVYAQGIPADDRSSFSETWLPRLSDAGAYERFLKVYSSQINSIDRLRWTMDEIIQFQAAHGPKVLDQLLKVNDRVLPEIVKNLALRNVELRPTSFEEVVYPLTDVRAFMQIFEVYISTKDVKSGTRFVHFTKTPIGIELDLIKQEVARYSLVNLQVFRPFIENRFLFRWEELAENLVLVPELIDDQELLVEALRYHILVGLQLVGDQSHSEPSKIRLGIKDLIQRVFSAITKSKAVEGHSVLKARLMQEKSRLDAEVFANLGATESKQSLFGSLFTSDEKRRKADVERLYKVTANIKELKSNSFNELLEKMAQRPAWKVHFSYLSKEAPDAAMTLPPNQCKAAL